MNSLDSIDGQVRRCIRCRLHETRQHAVPGEGPSEPEVFFIGQAPGRNEDLTGRPFVGMAGRFLDGVFREVGIDRKRVFLTGAVKCFPPKNRPPSWQEISACRPFLEAQLRTARPALIVCLGSAGASALFMEPVRVKDARTKPLSYGVTPVFVTYHPAAAMRFPEIRVRLVEDLRAILGRSAGWRP